MDLKDELIITGSVVARLEIEFPEDDAGDKLSISLKGRLTRYVAEVLGIGWMYQSDTTAHGGLADGRLDKSVEFSNVQFKLADDKGVLDTFFPEKVHSFRVFEIGGGQLGIQCKVDITGNANDVLDFLRDHRGQSFTFSLSSRQGELFEGGTRVDLSTTQNSPSNEDEKSVEDNDRSHENRPKGGRRKSKVRSIKSEPEDVAEEGQTELTEEDMVFIN